MLNRVAIFAVTTYATYVTFFPLALRLRSALQRTLERHTRSPEVNTAVVQGTVVGVAAVAHVADDERSVLDRRDRQALEAQVVSLAALLTQALGLAQQAAQAAQQEIARATAALAQSAELATEATEAKEQAAGWVTALADLTVQATQAKELAAAQVSALEAQLETAQRALEVMNRAQRGVDRLGLYMPPPPPGLVPTPGWSRCVAALKAVDAGYAKWAGREQKTLLISNYDDLLPARQTVDCKHRVNGAIGAYLRPNPNNPNPSPTPTPAPPQPQP